MQNLRKQLGLDRNKPRPQASKQPPPRPSKKGPKNPERMGGRKLKGRLPNLAKYEAVYDADKERWEGTLRIGDKVFEGAEGGIFRLLVKLDDRYRKSLRTPGPAV
jgi:hypothetical protein